MLSVVMLHSALRWNAVCSTVSTSKPVRKVAYWPLLLYLIKRLQHLFWIYTMKYKNLDQWNVLTCTKYWIYFAMLIFFPPSPEEMTLGCSKGTGRACKTNVMLCVMFCWVTLGPAVPVDATSVCVNTDAKCLFLHPHSHLSPERREGMS